MIILPFLRLGIEAVDIIDMDYPYWHTTKDDISRVSATSLGAVGNVIEKWIEQVIFNKFLTRETLYIRTIKPLLRMIWEITK